MGNITATILVPINVTAGANAINYTPSTSGCPILSMMCIGSSGSGVVKLTPLRSADVIVGGAGSGARIRVACNAEGAITTAEIAAGGTGYGATGSVPTTINDPFGVSAILSCTATGGTISGVSIISAGSNYSGYVSMDVSDFIEGVTYEIIPRYIENTGVGVLTLFGQKLSFKPFQVF